MLPDARYYAKKRYEESLKQKEDAEFRDRTIQENEWKQNLRGQHCVQSFHVSRHVWNPSRHEGQTVEIEYLNWTTLFLGNPVHLSLFTTISARTRQFSPERNIKNI